jgi:hypothetical protein
MKYRYSVNNDNQLLIKLPKTKESLSTRGRFDVDKDNRLTYWLNEPSPWRRKYNLPNKISFLGSWQLNQNYDLELVLEENKAQYADDSLVIKGEIISVDQDALAFEIKGIDQEGLLHIQILKLSGFWQADEYNRLSFLVKKKASPDTLTLEGAWQINPNQQIIYTYEKTGLKRKAKISCALTFAGFWQISSYNRLAYIISKSTNSKFDFKVQLETPNVYPKKGVIKYRIGVGLKEIIPENLKVISLYGVWKFSRMVGLIFEMEYAEGEFHSLEFGAEVNLTKNNQVSFKLINKDGEDLGIEVIFTHRFLSKLDAEFFLKLRRAKEENAVEAGVRIPF